MCEIWSAFPPRLRLVRQQRRIPYHCDSIKSLDATYSKVPREDLDFWRPLPATLLHPPRDGIGSYPLRVREWCGSKATTSRSADDDMGVMTEGKRENCASTENMVVTERLSL